VSINTEGEIDVFLNSLNIINEMHTCKTNDPFCEKTHVRHLSSKNDFIFVSKMLANSPKVWIRDTYTLDSILMMSIDKTGLKFRAHVIM